MAMTKTRMVIACYRPRPGRDQALLELVRAHVPLLRQEKLATSRPAYVMRAADGSIVEIFEWSTADAISRAHENRPVQSLWARFSEACDYVTLAELRETRELFAEFEPVDF